MFDHEDVASVNPLATRDEQLANSRQIYPLNAKRSASFVAVVKQGTTSR
jgi:hypothetical protein